MSNQSPTASGKDQLPRTDSVSDEKSSASEQSEARRRSPGTQAAQERPEPVWSHTTPGSAEGERDPDEQSR